MAIAAGRYYIINLGNNGSASTLPVASALALEVQKNSVANGANIRLYTLNYSNAQTWDVTYRSDGSARIMQHYSGKVADNKSGTLAQGNNVQLYQNNESAAQKWSIVEQSSSVTFEGSSYTKCKIQVASSSSWEIEANGSPGSVTAGTNIDIAATTSEADHYFIFVPVATFTNDGVYEIHSSVDPRMVVEVASNSKADGAAVILNSRTGQNNQKWAFEEVSTGVFGLRNLASGKYIHIKDAKAQAGQPVHQWAGKNATQCQWEPVLAGTTTYNNQKCQLMRFNSHMNAQFALDVKGAVTTPNATLQLNNSSNATNQTFILVPTDATDPNMPIPYSLGLAREYEATASAHDLASLTARQCKTALYLTWFASDAWITDGANHYQVRYRTRDMSPTTSAYGAWSSWVGWIDAPCVVRGNQAWMVTPMAGMYQFTTSKHRQIEFQVRSVGAGDDINVVSSAASKVVDINKPTTADLTSAGYSMDGLHLGYTSNYSYGSNRLILRSIMEGTTELLKNTYTAVGMDNATSVVVPNEYLVRMPTDGATLRIQFSCGNDQWADYGIIYTNSLTVEFDSSHGASATPTLTGQDATRTILATVAHIGTERMWLVVDGVPHELEGVVNGSNTAFLVPYPFGVDFQLWTMVQTSDGESWGTNIQTITTGTAGLTDAPACHAWTWGNEGCILELRKDGDAETQHTLTAIASTWNLSGREFQTVGFSGTSQGTYPVTGYLLDGTSQADIVDFMQHLFNAHHVLYRSPHGDVANVAIMTVQQTSTLIETQITVTQTEESI